MSHIDKINNEVKEVFNSYPLLVQTQLLAVRTLIFEVAKNDGIGDVNETLKWGEPSYLSKNGATLRIAWKAKNHDHISIYFNCKTTLIDTFREIYGDIFTFVGNREILLPIAETIPVQALQACLSMSLRYHKIKHLPLLGG